MVKITAQRGEVEAYVMELVADKLVDIPTIINVYPKAAAGSICICLEDSSVWMLGGNKTWKEI